MFDSPYSYHKIAECNTLLPDPVKRLHYKFTARHRKYFVTLEVFSYNIVAVKYCDVKDKNAYNAYNKIFNDGDAFRVIATCIYIMRDYWTKFPSTSFIFYAAPRDFKSFTASMLKKKVERPRNIRFTIYRYAMINLFPPGKFRQLQDTRNNLYVLLNKQQEKPKSMLKQLSIYLLESHDIIFELENALEPAISS